MRHRPITFLALLVALLLCGAPGAQAVSRGDAYYPFGRVETASPQASFPVSRRFTGQVFDAESGLYFYGDKGGRYYDPELGRFIQADTEIPDLSNPQSYNRYSYCVNNPLRFTDPSGHDPAYSMMFAGLSASETMDAARIAAPITVGMTVAMATGGAATPLLVSAGASTMFAAVGSGMIAGATGDLALQSAQIGLGQRSSINGQEVAVSSLAGGALSGSMSKLASIKATPAVADAPSAATTLTGREQAGNPLFRPGPFAEKSIPAQSSAQAFTQAERNAINNIGRDTGCHTCGVTDPGTKSGNFVPDHQPVSALNTANTPQQLYPQCINCSRQQGLAVARALKDAKQ